MHFVIGLIILSSKYLKSVFISYVMYFSSRVYKNVELKCYVSDDNIFRRRCKPSDLKWRPFYWVQLFRKWSRSVSTMKLDPSHSVIVYVDTQIGICILNTTWFAAGRSVYCSQWNCPHAPFIITMQTQSFNFKYAFFKAILLFVYYEYKVI